MMNTFREYEGVDTTAAHINDIIDGFERPFQKPQDDEAAAACWSTYKHNYIAKFLLGILSSSERPSPRESSLQISENETSIIMITAPPHFV